ncbi:MULTISPECIES: META domain-containing protein [Neisseria]|nr:MULTISPECIES: META domain-containing protein [Neisseria]UOO84275.1 META domain-containing protein [Neisseria dumasiana]
MMKRFGLILPLFLIGACTTSVAVPLGNHTQPLQGSWQIKEAEGQTVRPEVVMMLDGKDKAFSISTDCNRVFGRYIASSDKKLQFGGIASTLMACPDAATEQQLTRILPLVRSYRFVGQHIEMFDRQGKTLLRGERVKGN